MHEAHSSTPISSDLRDGATRSGNRVGKRQILVAGIVISLLATALLLSILLFDGADRAGRAAVDLAGPVGLLWLFLLGVSLAFFLSRQSILGCVFLVVWLTMSLAFNGHVAQAFFASVERAPAEGPEAESLRREFPLRAVVTLGGAAGINFYGIDELNNEGERVVSAAQMWHAGEVRCIICTGASADPRRDQPGKIARRLLLSLGVPDEAIVMIGGEDTQGELASLRELLHDPPTALQTPGQIGLITSAFHMDRALRMAEQASVDVVPLPVAHRRGRPKPWSPYDVIPTAGAAQPFQAAMKETLAKWLGA